MMTNRLLFFGRSITTPSISAVTIESEGILCVSALQRIRSGKLKQFKQFFKKFWFFNKKKNFVQNGEKSTMFNRMKVYVKEAKEEFDIWLVCRVIDFLEIIQIIRDLFK